MEEQKIFSYDNYNNKNYNIKELIFKKLNLNKEYKIETLEDIGNFSILFFKSIPYQSFYADNGLEEYNIDYTISCIENGGFCVHLNILIGLLLKEIFNLKIYLYNSNNSKNNILEKMKCHCFNIFTWSDGKIYYHDVGLCSYNSYYPIEIGNVNFTIIKNPKFQYFNYRVIEIKNNYSTSNLKTFALQRLKNPGKEISTIIEFSVDLYNLNDTIPFRTFEQISNYFIEKNAKIYIKLSDKGLLKFYSNQFLITTPSNITKFEYNNFKELNQLFIQFFNIDLTNNSFFEKNYLYSE